MARPRPHPWLSSVLCRMNTWLPMGARIGVWEACRVKLGRSRGPRARMGEKTDFQCLEILPTFYPELAGRARHVLWSPWAS